jgi:hypothetical protein
MPSPLKIAVAGAVLLALGAGVALTFDRSTTDDPVGAPCLVIWQYPGYPAPRQRVNAGLEVAVWPDGAMLLSPVRSALGEHMMAGKVDAADLKAALSAIRDAGFQKLKNGSVVPDASCARITVAEEGKVTTNGWHECLLPGFGGDINADAEYRAFVRTWKKTRAAIESIAPIELRALKEKEDFRGYVTIAPEKTNWRP